MLPGRTSNVSSRSGPHRVEIEHFLRDAQGPRGQDRRSPPAGASAIGRSRSRHQPRGLGARDRPAARVTGRQACAARWPGADRPAPTAPAAPLPAGGVWRRRGPAGLLGRGVPGGGRDVRWVRLTACISRCVSRTDAGGPSRQPPKRSAPRASAPFSVSIGAGGSRRWAGRGRCGLASEPASRSSSSCPIVDAGWSRPAGRSSRDRGTTPTLARSACRPGPRSGNAVTMAADPTSRSGRPDRAVLRA